jgi:sensor histidine kinase YesM
MRNTLQISEKPYITLEEEITLLQLYVDLEKVRFEEDLECNFIFKLDDKCKEDFIPSMLLQPFVENAFKHGLLHKKGEKKLNITFENQQENLLVTIDDNGIGREHAKEIQIRQARKSTGFALNATTQRIDLLNKITSYNIKIEILDKYNAQNEPEGTRILVNLKLKK